MKTFKNKLLTIAMLLCSISVSAYDFEVDGLYYYITSEPDLTVGVTYRVSYKYTGEVVIPESITYKNTVYSVTSIGSSAFNECSGLTSITIPNSVTSIGYNAFDGCTRLANITIPNSVTTIRDNAFQNCKSLTSITIPNSVTSIGGEAFKECSGLTNITIPNSVTNIGYGAFSQCRELTNITIPNSVTKIGLDAFSNCTGLMSMVVEEGNNTYDSRENCNAIIHTKNNELIFGCQSTVIPNSVTSIGTSAFWGCTGLTNITIPESVTSIEEFAFCGCSSLTSIVIDKSVTFIGIKAFVDCWNLKTVINLSEMAISKGSESNGKVAYYATEVINADGQVGNFFFTTTQGTHSLIYYLKNKDDKEIVLPDNYKGENYEIGNDVFSGYTGLTNITIPNSVTEIGLDAFKGCSSLTSISIPNSVTSIGYRAFSGCSGLTSIIIGNSVTSIGNYAFDGCKNLKIVINLSEMAISKGSESKGEVAYYATEVINADGQVGNFFFTTTQGTHSLIYYLKNKDDKEIVLPDNYKGENYGIGNDVFRGCNGLTSITIPNSVTSIGDYAFFGCSLLTNISISNSVKSIGKNVFSGTVWWTNQPDGLIYLSNYLLGYKEDKPIGNISIENDTKVIGADAFSGCSGLTSITIPNSVTSIGKGVFKGCSGLTSITIPNSITSIEDYAFNDCSGLTSIIIGNSVTSIGNYAFDGCKNLKIVINLSEMAISKGSESKGEVAYYATEVINADGQVGNFFFTTTQGTHSLIYYLKNKDDKEIVLPDNYKGENYKVGNDVFRGCTGLTSVTIPNSVTSIGEGAFYNCDGLTSVIIPESVTSIRKSTFYDCDGLTSVTIPESITSIGESTFYDCN